MNTSQLTVIPRIPAQSLDAFTARFIISIISVKPKGGNSAPGVTQMPLQQLE